MKLKEKIIFERIGSMESNKRKYPCIPTACESRHYPLSFQQERVLYLSQLLPDNTYWNRLSTKRLKGEIKVDLLKKALFDLTCRHNVLKTKISMENNMPVQSFKDGKEIDFQIVDLTGLDENGMESAALDVLYKECRTPIDVNGDQLFKAILITLGKNDYMLILKLHHIITDATSFHILWQDLKHIYNSYLGEGSSILDELNINYSDYAVWQKEAFREENTREQEKYWIKQFEGEIPILNLPEDYPATRHISYKGAVEKEMLSPELVKGLKALSMKKRVILFSTLLSAYFILLQKYCQQDDIVVGTVFSGRQYSNDIKRLAGFFINTVALRMQVNEDTEFEELLKLTHHKVDEAYYMQDYPFERIIEKINPDRSRSQNPLFRAMFNMVNSYTEKACFTGVSEEKWIWPEINSTQVDVLFEVHNYDDRDLEIRVEYNTDVFKKETIRQMLKHYKHLLENVVKTPEAKITQLDIFDYEEQKRFLSYYNYTYVPYQINRTMHSMFEEQEIKMPNELAVICEDKYITYRELNARANQVARRLREKGAKPNQLIGVFMDRSIEMIVGVLGILKSGAAYLPIEPSYPRERIKYILENSKASLVLTQSKYGEAFDSSMEVVLIEDPSIYLEDGSNLESVNSPEDLAYTIYTSGSTGKPKGVMIKHISAVNTICDINSKFSVCEKDRIIGLSSISFDLSVYDIFGALSTGAALVQIKDQRNVSEITDVLKKYNITIWNSVPAIMDMLIENLKQPFSNMSLRLVLLSGDWIPLKLPEKIKRYFQCADVISLGGATEASIWSIYYPIKEVREEWRSIPYGMPLANQTFYVLDKAMKLCPYGVRGELFIGGVGVAIGYMNDEEKTNASFINHPKYGYLYRTGDWGRFHKEGYIEFLGRKDQQIKIRGYRIELGEIEKNLLLESAVREAVAVVREDTPGNKRIVAYLVMNPGAETGASELQEHLEKWLPHYMIPAAFVMLDSFPLSSNGKVDIKALPAPDDKFEAEKGYEAPKTDVEKKLVQISEKILNVKPIGLNDNFFRIGGNSLLTIRFISEIEEAFGISMTMLDFIDLPVISEIAKNIESMLPQADSEEENIKEQANYWKRQLNGIPEFLDIRNRQSSTSEHKFICKAELFEVDSDLTEKLIKLSRRYYTSLSMSLMAAFAVILKEFSRQSDIVIGIPNIDSDISLNDSFTMKQMFNALPIRIDLSGNTTFQELLAGVREVVLDANANKDISFERIVKDLCVKLNPDYYPLFQAMFEYVGQSDKYSDHGDLSLSIIDNNGTKPDLLISIIETEYGLRGKLEYNSCLFDEASIRHMVDLYISKLKWVVENSETNIYDAELSVQ